MWKLKTGREAVVDSARKTQVAAVATTAAAALCGYLENRDAAQPINDISHIVWGDEAHEQNGISLKYTGTGLWLNQSAHASWSLLHETLFGAAQDEGNVPVALGGGALISALAYVVDYYLVPKRLTPGFEKHLSSRSLLFIYIVLALALGLGGKRR